MQWVSKKNKMSISQLRTTFDSIISNPVCAPLSAKACLASWLDNCMWLTAWVCVVKKGRIMFWVSIYWQLELTEPYLMMKYLRSSQSRPIQPSEQEQVLGRWHTPPFWHCSQHTAEGDVHTHEHIRLITEECWLKHTRIHFTFYMWKEKFLYFHINNLLTVYSYRVEQHTEAIQSPSSEIRFSCHFYYFCRHSLQNICCNSWPCNLMH